MRCTNCRRRLIRPSARVVETGLCSRCRGETQPDVRPYRLTPPARPEPDWFLREHAAAEAATIFKEA